MSYGAHYCIRYTGHQDSHMTFACVYCRYEIVGRRHRAASLFERFVLHLEGSHLDKLALANATLVCAHCERESAEKTWTDGACPECGAFSLLPSRAARLARALEKELNPC